MSALSPDKDRRGSQRYTLPKPVPATLGGYPGTLTEFSLTGCRFLHTDRVAPKQTLSLRFKWRGTDVRINSLVIRSEMTGLGKKASYLSGLEFCESPNDAPPVVREVVAFLVKESAKNAPPPPSMEVEEPLPELIDEEPEMLAAPYLRCTLSGGKWLRIYSDDASQPAEGFTIATPSDDKEADVLCRSYEKAGPQARAAMRKSFADAIARSKR